MTLSIERGASIPDITLVLESDRASARKVNTHFVARTQSRMLYAWTWRRPDTQPVICAGMHWIGRGPLPGARLEAWFTCRPDLTTAEVRDFILFARLVLWCVWWERKPPAVVAWVGAGRSTGKRLARLMGFTTDADQGGQTRMIWNPEKDLPCPVSSQAQALASSP